MIFEIALSLFTLTSVFLFAHIKIKKNRDFIFEKIQDDKKRIENEINNRLSLIEDKQVKSLKNFVDQIESKQLAQQDILEEIKVKILSKNTDEINNKVKFIQCQIQELTQHLDELKQKIIEDSSVKSSHNLNNDESDEMHYASFSRIKVLDRVKDLASTEKQHHQAATETEQVIDKIIEKPKVNFFPWVFSTET